MSLQKTDQTLEDFILEAENNPDVEITFGSDYACIRDKSTLKEIKRIEDTRCSYIAMILLQRAVGI